MSKSRPATRGGKPPPQPGVGNPLHNQGWATAPPKFSKTCLLVRYNN